MDNRYALLNEKLKSTENGVIYKYSFTEDSGQVTELEAGYVSDEEMSSEEMKQILLDGVPVLKKEENRTTFYEPFYKRERLIILGAGHVGATLCKLAKMTGFYVIVIDDREDCANRNKFPNADEIIVDDYRAGIRKVVPDKSDYFVIVTRDHYYDTECLLEMMNFDEPLYLGMIGSKRRTAIVFNELEAEGFSRERMDHVCTPIGLPIGAKTLEEIAVSIIAELIQRRREDSKGSAYIDRGDHDMADVDVLSEITQPCVLVTVLETVGSAPRGAGACMAVFKDGSIKGSTGGGSAEGEIIEAARKLVGSGRYLVYRANFTAPTGMKSSMVCGGNIVALMVDITL